MMATVFALDQAQVTVLVVENFHVGSRLRYVGVEKGGRDRFYQVRLQRIKRAGCVRRGDAAGAGAHGFQNGRAVQRLQEGVVLGLVAGQLDV